MKIYVDLADIADVMHTSLDTSMAYQVIVEFK